MARNFRDNWGMQFGLMNALGKLAGDGPVASLVLCTLVPLLCSGLPQIAARVKWLLSCLWDVNTKHYRRMIVFKSGENLNLGNGGAEETSTERNNILQKAIRLYINKSKGKLDIQDAELYLLAEQSKDLPPCDPELKYGRRDIVATYAHRSRVRNIGDLDAGLKRLMGYSVVRGPKQYNWLMVDAERQVQFRYYLSTGYSEQCDGGVNMGKGSVRGGGAATVQHTTTTFELRCCGPDAQRSVDSFVEEALDHYKSLKSAAVDHSRYLFMPVGVDDNDFYGKGGGKGFDGRQKYKKYVLSEHKTFESLFFQEKGRVLSLLDDFLHLRGKFATEGFPNKLGLLLHGPPGTGKTSLIKSIAQYTKRHVVEVPLTKVKTNQELFDSMFDLVFPVKGDDEAFRMDFKDVIFVMEDIDAASKIVYSREGDGKEKEMDSVSHCTSPGYGRASGHFEAGSKCKQGRGKGSDDVTKAFMQTPANGHSAAPPMYLLAAKPIAATKSQDSTAHAGEATRNSATEACVDSDEAEQPQYQEPKPGFGTGGACSKGAAREELDALNLAGLLNVLDGVVDSPGRIVVMTTNHPEKLDPALIRPGRINISIKLGFMQFEPLVELIEHLMHSQMTDDQRELAAKIVAQDCVIPAKVEQMGAECNTMDELLFKLGQHAGRVWASHREEEPLANHS